MTPKEIFKQEKKSFVSCVAICATIWFLAVCVLFGLYIYCSFHNSSTVEQYANGSYNNHQEINR